MSLHIQIPDTKPSEVMRAMHSIYPTHISGTGWETLDGMEKELFENAPRYWNRALAYKNCLLQIQELSRILKLLSKHKSAASQRAQEYVNTRLKEFMRESREHEVYVSPPMFMSFLTAHLYEGCQGSLVPGRQMEIRVPSLPDNVVIQLYNLKKHDHGSYGHRPDLIQGVRRLGYEPACSMLRTLSSIRKDSYCAVARETTMDTAASTEAMVSGTPTDCLKMLRSHKGRSLAHKKLPPFDAAGNIIPA